MPTGTRLYVGTEEGLYVYHSAADAWQEVNHGITSGLFWAMSGCPNQPERVSLKIVQQRRWRFDGDAEESGLELAEGVGAREDVDHVPVFGAVDGSSPQGRDQACANDR